MRVFESSRTCFEAINLFDTDTFTEFKMAVRFKPANCLKISWAQCLRPLRRNIGSGSPRRTVCTIYSSPTLPNFLLQPILNFFGNQLLRVLLRSLRRCWGHCLLRRFQRLQFPHPHRKHNRHPSPRQVSLRPRSTRHPLRQSPPLQKPRSMWRHQPRQCQRPLSFRPSGHHLPLPYRFPCHPQPRMVKCPCTPVPLSPPRHFQVM
jgi:hypothetical protein